MNALTDGGFTLVELLVAITVAGILLGVGVPSFAAVLQEVRLAAQAGQLGRALYLARSEAVKRGEFVTLCPRSGAALCGGASDWDGGWLVFADPTSNSVPIEPLASVDAGDEILATSLGGGTHHHLDVYGVLGAGGDNRQAAAWVRYGPEGTSTWSGGPTFGSFVICDEVRGAAHSRVLNVGITGSIRAGHAASEGLPPRDVRGVAIVCDGDP